MNSFVQISHTHSEVELTDLAVVLQVKCYRSLQIQCQNGLIELKHIFPYDAWLFHWIELQYFIEMQADQN